MDDLFNLLSSSARIKKKPKRQSNGYLSSSNKRSKVIHEFTSKTEKEKDAMKNFEQVHTEEMAAFRRRMRIRVANSSQCPDPICSFDEMKLKINQSNGLFQTVKSTILANIETGKWLEPTPVQMQSIPALLAGQDVMAAAPTGSGKSGCFIIPAIILSKCIDSSFDGGETDGNDGGHQSNEGSSKKRKSKKKETQKSSAGQIRALFLAPSRELAAQIHRETVRLGSNLPGKLRCALLNKSNFTSLVTGKLGGDNGLDILVTTPLRLFVALQSENSKVDLSHVRLVYVNPFLFLLYSQYFVWSSQCFSYFHTRVLDEADRLLDATDGVLKAKREGNKESGSAHAQSFVEQIDSLLGACGNRAVRAMFSATMGGRIHSLAETVLRSPVDITINSHGGAIGANTDIDQKLVFVGREEGKLLEIRKLINKGIKPPVLIFLQSQERAQALYKELKYENVNADVIHAKRSQKARDLAVQNFRKGETWVLICTDLVARGVDFKAVNLVINYDLPASGVTYVHRIGRTGRAGRKGESITFFTEDDFDQLRSVSHKCSKITLLIMNIMACEKYVLLFIHIIHYMFIFLIYYNINRSQMF